jgi:hypothetical protein
MQLLRKATQPSRHFSTSLAAAPHFSTRYISRATMLFWRSRSHLPTCLHCDRHAHCFNVSSRVLLPLVENNTFIVWRILITTLIFIVQIGLVSDGDTAARAQKYSLLACSFTWRVRRFPYILISYRERRASCKPVQCCARLRSSEGAHCSPNWRRF